MAGTKTSPRIAAAVALILGPLAGWLAFEGWQERRLATASEPSACDVLGLGTGPTDEDGAPEGDATVPWVILVHTIAGERFERRDEGPSSDTEAEAREAIADLSPGQRVPCRYVPGAPQLVVYFERDAGAGTGELVGAGAAALGVLGVLGWAILRSRRRR